MKRSFNKSRWDVVYDQVCLSKSDAEISANVFKGKCKKYILTSSQSVYPSGANMSENSFDYKKFRDSDHSDHDYQHGKRMAEATLGNEGDLPVTAVRFPIVMGEDDYTGRLLWHIERIINGVPLYFPNLYAKISFITSDEAAQFLLWAGLHNSLCGPINACSLGVVSLKQFLGWIENAVGKRSTLARSPAKQNHSPYGISNDWHMDNSLATDLGFNFSQISDWLPSLVVKQFGKLSTTRSKAERFVQALDNDEFETAKIYLDDNCEYSIGEDKIVGSGAIVESYKKNSEAGRKKIDKLEYKSKLRAESDDSYVVTYFDNLTHKGLKHTYSCQQCFRFNKKGKIANIEHVEMPGERQKLNEFYCEVGLS